MVPSKRSSYLDWQLHISKQSFVYSRCSHTSVSFSKSTPSKCNWPFSNSSIQFCLSRWGTALIFSNLNISHWIYGRQYFYTVLSNIQSTTTKYFLQGTIKRRRLCCQWSYFPHRSRAIIIDWIALQEVNKDINRKIAIKPDPIRSRNVSRMEAGVDGSCSQLRFLWVSDSDYQIFNLGWNWLIEGKKLIVSANWVGSINKVFLSIVLAF